MDWKDIGVQAINALTPVVVLVLVWALKLAWSKVPASIVLFAAPVLGVLVNFALQYIAGHPAADPVVAASLGLLATTLREWLTTFGSKGVSGSVTPTKLSF